VTKKTHRGHRKVLEPSSTRRARAISGRGWKRPFDDPIALPRGRQLVTLEDAAKYIQKLPKAEQKLPEWQAAVEALLLVVDNNGPTMMARIGVMRALNRFVVREFESSRKDAHWGKRKLKRAERKTRRRESAPSPLLVRMLLSRVSVSLSPPIFC
jgi:hypothetical protein